MPILFLCFIVFIIWFRVKSKQSEKKPTWDENFWNKERKANFSRKKSLDDIEYLQLDLSRLPLSDDPDEDEADCQMQINTLSHAKILNLNSMSNTDIKLKYGLANFETLSVYDANYTKLVRVLGQWGNLLYDKEDYSRAKMVYTYALDIGSDLSKTYTNLARIYLSEDNISAVSELVQKADGLDSFMKENIKKQLSDILASYA